MDLKKLFKKYKKHLRAFLGWLGGLLLQISVVGADVMAGWSGERWALGLAVAALPGIVGLISVGDPNPTDEELYSKVHAVKKKRAMAGLEVTDPIGLKLPPAPVLPPEPPKP
jgi:hypothetical protein